MIQNEYFRRLFTFGARDEKDASHDDKESPASRGHMDRGLALALYATDHAEAIGVRAELGRKDLALLKQAILADWDRAGEVERAKYFARAKHAIFIMRTFGDFQ